MLHTIFFPCQLINAKLALRLICGKRLGGGAEIYIGTLCRRKQNLPFASVALLNTADLLLCLRQLQIAVAVSQILILFGILNQISTLCRGKGAGGV